MTKTIAVFGGTGAQGGGVVRHLLGRKAFGVRVITRNPQSKAAASLAEQGCEVAPGDLADSATLKKALQGVHGVFLVTNFWDPATAGKEHEQGTAAVKAARESGVRHLVWSTLPNCREISGGRYEVVHFTNKARVDKEVEAAGFPYHTFVEAPMYFQNFAGMMAPQPQGDGSKLWAFPMAADNRCIHGGDIDDLGKLVARVFEEPETAGKGQRLSVTPGAMSWQDMMDVLNAQGHRIRYARMPDADFDNLPFPGAAELREMMNYWEEFTYFGPDAETKIARAKALVAGGLTSFEDWARDNMKP